MGLFLFLRDVVMALLDVALGRRRRRYEHWVDIRAPRRVVWDMLKARDIAFDGLFQLRVIAQPVPGRPGCERVHIRAGNTELVMLTQIIDERPGDAILYQLMPEGTDAALVEGDDDFIGFVLQETATGTRLDLTRETTPRRHISRLTIPLGLRGGARRYKRKAEQMADAAGAAGPEARAE